MVPILLVVLPLSIDPHFMVSSEDVQQQVNQGDNCGTNDKRTEIKLYAMHTFAIALFTLETPCKLAAYLSACNCTLVAQGITLMFKF